jgi:Rod binding domain-containing protein
VESLLSISPWDLSAQQAQATRLKANGTTREQLSEAARGFEDVMIRKWIEAARKANIDPAKGVMASYQTMADDQLAFLVSRQGGFGLAKPMVDQMMAQIAAREPAPGVDTTSKSLKQSLR